MTEQEDGTAATRKPGETDEQFQDRLTLQSNISGIKRKIMVLSGKGGVGKSTIAVNLAMSLSLQGRDVGLMDVDFHGPSVPTLLGITELPPMQQEGRIPPAGYENLKVISIGFLLPRKEDAVIWRGPMKMGAVRQFLRDVEWGPLDYLVVDSPPGTGDEPLSVAQVLEKVDGAVIVTTPQELSVSDVRKSITFCHRLAVPVLGVVENMSGFACPKCGEVSHIFGEGGGKKMAGEMGVPFLGTIPMDPVMVKAGDEGKPFVYHYANSPAAKAMEEIADRVRGTLEGEETVTRKEEPAKADPKGETMKIAMPTAEGNLCLHFGHCQKFAVVEVDTGARKVLGTAWLDPPSHEPGALPKLLSSQGVHLVIAGGMGMRAQEFFKEFGVDVVVGATPGPPEEIAMDYLEGKLQTGNNICDH